MHPAREARARRPHAARPAGVCLEALDHRGRLWLDVLRGQELAQIVQQNSHSDYELNLAPDAKQTETVSVGGAWEPSGQIAALLGYCEDCGRSWEGCYATHPSPHGCDLADAPRCRPVGGREVSRNDCRDAGARLRTPSSRLSYECKERLLSGPSWAQVLANEDGI
jgi:hypothetical protein